MAKKKQRELTWYDRSFIAAWVRWWRKPWFDEIIKNLKT